MLEAHEVSIVTLSLLDAQCSDVDAMPECLANMPTKPYAQDRLRRFSVGSYGSHDDGQSDEPIQPEVAASKPSWTILDTTSGMRMSFRKRSS